MIFRPLFAGLGLLAATPAAAHDFWLQPEAFELDEPQDVQVRFLIGHASEVENWNLRWDRVVALRHHKQGAVRDLQSRLTPQNGMVPGRAEVAIEEPGTHMVAFESHHSFSDLEADRFNAYAKKEGLARVLAAREEAGTDNQNGRELYSRRAKLLLQLGDEATGNVLEPIGHSLEIVPERNPYALGADRMLPVQVLFRGRPLEGATIDITELGSGEEPYEEKVTDAEGRAAFELAAEGAYKLNVIWGFPNPDNSQAEFETIFTSLTFGYPSAD